MDRLETSGYYALGVPFYLLLIAVEWYRTRRLGLHAYRFADTIGNVSAGLGELIIGLFLGPWLIALYDFAYAHFALIHWPKGSIAQWVVAFLAADLGYYWYHRAGHRFGALWAIHGVHHQSEQFNFTIAMRHPWLSDTYSAVFYAPLPLLGVEPTVFFVSISAISFYALTVHTRLFHRPTMGIFVTPATHIVHHCRNPRYIGRNLGAMFILWDKLFGTYTEIVPEDPPDIGTPAGYQTHDGAKAQAIFFRDLWRAARQAPDWRTRLRALTARPGWLPPGATRVAEPAARADATIAPAVRAHVAVQFVGVLGFSIVLLWLREQHAFALLASAGALVLWSLWVLGGLLDGRPTARVFEAVRLLLTAGFGAVLLADPAYLIVGAGLLACSALGGAWLLAFWRAFAVDEAVTPPDGAPAT